MELGVSILFTPEETEKQSSVYELSTASKMMFLVSISSIPKDLGINLVAFKDKHKRLDIIETETDGFGS